MEEVVNAAKAAEVRAVLEEAERKKEETKARRQFALDEQRAQRVSKGLVEGEDFAVIDGGAEGPIVVEPPATGRGVMYKRFRQPIDDLKNGKLTIENCMSFVAPCVTHPAKESFLAICDKRPGLAFTCANELNALLGENQATELGK